MMRKNCLYCGKRFTGRPHRKYCCQYCANNMKSKIQNSLELNNSTINGGYQAKLCLS